MEVTMKCVGARTGVRKAGDFTYEFQQKVVGLIAEPEFLVPNMGVWCAGRKYEIGDEIKLEVGDATRG